ncbi:MAG: universal stress protein [Gemmatimonadaceae bacterium]|nr:universal stress protein [Gemmatimonadaceae bacterium]
MIAPFRTVLVPLDGSAASAYAIPFAAGAAAPIDGALYLSRVHETAPSGVPMLGNEPVLDYRADADTRLAQADALELVANEAKAATGLAVHWALLDDGVPADVLRAHAEDIGADLVVMSTHGRAGVSRAIFGSVTTAVVAATHLPVLVVRPVGTVPSPPLFYRRIAVLLDGSSLSESVIEPALRLGSAAAASLELVRVVVPTPIPMAPGAMPLAMVDPDEYEREVTVAGEYLERVAATVRARGYTVSTRVERGTIVAHAIAEYVQRERVDAIAMATHARRGVSRALLGSVAEDVVRHVTKPVLLYRPE